MTRWPQSRRMIRPSFTIFAVLIASLLHSLRPELNAFDPAQQDDSLAVLRHFSRSTGDGAAQPEFAKGQFELQEGETVTLIGGSEMEEMAEFAYFEAHLQQAFAAKRPVVRSIAWSADTVFRQQRPMFFFTEVGDMREGSVADGRGRIGPGAMIVQFGKMESLDGEAALDEFLDSYETLVSELKKISLRIVLVSPSPFFAVGPAADLAADRNAVLEKYSTAIEDISNRQKTLFVDLRSALDPGDASLSRNGIHLSENGQRHAATVLANALWKTKADAGTSDALRAAIQKKNFLWQQYFRPTNWAFLYGDRQHVPSSHDHKDTDRRWFIEELNQLPGRIAAADSDIWKEAGQ